MEICEDTKSLSPTIFEDAKNDREKFWENQAACLHWFSPWDRVLDWNPPYAQWFLSGKLNACYNCVDRHQTTQSRHKAALIWEGERGEKLTLTYEDLYIEVNKFANVLKSLKIQKGDKVAIYLPMICEAIVAMLSCARIGAVHTVVFGGFSHDALKDRIHDSDAKLVITSDGGFRKGKHIFLKESCDRALCECPSVKNVLVIRHTHNTVSMKEGRDHWYHELKEKVSPECPPVLMDAEDELFILYTSGTTGKPKGIVHTTGGYLVGATMTMRWVFDVKSTDVYWCTADIGWITGHSYVVYGPLSNGLTQVIYEGAFDFPEQDRVWQIIEKYKVSIFYTSPTAIRTFMKWGDAWLKKHDLSSLRMLGTVGEAINQEAWNWYYKNVGNNNCPIADTWWQTETGSIMIAPFYGHTPLKPASATQPMPGIEIACVNDVGDFENAGYLAITSPWPSMLRGIHKDPKRYEETYWKKWDGNFYFTGDGAKIDEDGYFWLQGRVDDVINVSGHRLSTSELESALTEYHGIVEAAAIAVNHEIKGQGIVCFVTVRDGHVHDENEETKIKQHIVNKIGALARPEKIIFILELPKTRSGKIMRRLLRDIAEGRILGDTSTLFNHEALEQIKGKYKDENEK